MWAMGRRGRIQQAILKPVLLQGCIRRSDINKAVPMRKDSHTAGSSPLPSATSVPMPGVQVFAPTMNSCGI